MSDLPPPCKAESDPPKSPDEVKERISEIPTRRVLPSECDRQLLAVSATKLVNQYRDRIVEFLNQP
jgi:hypothetical protein